ncbi:hypothetical protein F5Y19DRAFT_410096 [Xylariaceae sp. FL1651]|nr:hypothetical protein F5Y19DRAFT_410096 [Xylariaceae sp. FL1651]
MSVTVIVGFLHVKLFGVVDAGVFDSDLIRLPDLGLNKRLHRRLELMSECNVKCVRVIACAEGQELALSLKGC